MSPLQISVQSLDELYVKYDRRDLVHPDPLEFLYDYPDLRDREVVALLASSLAYGRVAQILRNVSTCLERMPSPAAFLERRSRKQLSSVFSDVRHRFTSGHDIAALLYAAKRVMIRRGSLEACFAAGSRDDDETVLPGLSALVGELTEEAGPMRAGLLPSPSAGSACKRLNLFLRWMVRQDNVDPGGWDSVSPAKLIIPLDTHMHRIGRRLGLTPRRQADLRTAIEITEGFRGICPSDPVRYDLRSRASASGETRVSRIS